MTRTRALVVVILIQFVCLGWLGYKIVGAVNSIQAQRVSVTRSLCEAQNTRHRETIRALDGVLARASRGASRAKRIEIYASRAPTILLINQLAPYQDCNALVRFATTGH